MTTPQVDVFVYARMDSTRLPGKALKEVGGMKLIERVIRRAKMVSGQRCVLLTSRRRVDDPLVQVAGGEAIEVVRGEADNLVARTVQAIKELGTEVFVRVNGDSPFFEPRLVEQIIPMARSQTLVSNLPLRQFPYGVALELVGADIYLEHARSARTIELEHCTAHLYREVVKDLISIRQTRNDSDLKLAIDTASDLNRIGQSLTRNSFAAPYWEVFGREAPEIAW